MMPKQHIALLISIAGVTGFFGGALSNFVLHPEPVHAQAGQLETLEVKHIASEILATKHFVLLDEQGNMRAGFTVANGDVGLGLMDKAGKVRLGLAVDENGPVITFNDPKEKPKFVLKVENDGVPHLYFKDAYDEQRLAMSLFAGDPAIRLFDASGRGIQLIDKDGRSRAAFGVDTTGEARLKIFGKDFRETIWSAP